MVYTRCVKRAWGEWFNKCIGLGCGVYDLCEARLGGKWLKECTELGCGGVYDL